MPSAGYDEATALQEQATALIQELRRAVRLRQAALAAGNEAEAAGWATHIANLGRAYNTVVGRLYELERGSATLAFLDKVGDVAIGGIKSGAVAVMTAAGDVVEGVGKVVGETAAAAVKPLLGPLLWVVAGAALLIFVAGRSGFFRATASASV